MYWAVGLLLVVVLSLLAVQAYQCVRNKRAYTPANTIDKDEELADITKAEDDIEVGGQEEEEEVKHGIGTKVVANTDA